MSGDSEDSTSEYEFQSIAPDELDEQEMAACIDLVSKGGAVSPNSSLTPRSKFGRT